MTRKWVGWTTCLVLLAASIGAGGASAEYEEQFRDPENTPWVAVSGNIEIESTHGSQGRLLEYIKVEGDGSGTLPFAHAHVDPQVVDTDLTAYKIEALIERDAGYGNPGWFGITFGERTGEGYLAGFDDDEFFLADISSGTPAVFFTANTTQDEIDLDKRLRYTLKVAGDSLQVEVNGFPLVSTNLPTTASGHFGLAADTGTSIHSQKVTYRIFDDEPPKINIFRPEANNLYIEDASITSIPTGGLAVVVGEITLGADILDPLSGVENALLLLNGQYVPGSKTTETGHETAWTLDTFGLDAGIHEITIRAKDNNGNIAESSVEFLVISPNVNSGTIDAAEDVLENLIP